MEVLFHTFYCNFSRAGENRSFYRGIHFEVHGTCIPEVRYPEYSLSCLIAMTICSSYGMVVM